MHEIVTIQIGAQSNYLATHFWNAQESYFTYSDEQQSLTDHDIHFRPGIGADGSETFTPRTIIYDLKSNFGTLRQTNALYELQYQNPVVQSGGLWNTNSPTVIRHQQTIPVHVYQQHLDAGLSPPSISTDTVRYWSDYNRVFFHPRSLVQIRDNDLQARLGPFENWEVGGELFDNLEKENGDIIDSDLRPFVEECDQMQGLQMITVADNAWGSLATKYAERLRDEYGKGVVWIYGLDDANTKPREKRLQHFTNIAKSIHELSTQASLYIPISNIPSHIPSNVSMDRSSPWQTSALQAAALESITIPSRLHLDDSSHDALASLEAVFTNDSNRRILELSLGCRDPRSVLNEANGAHDPRTQSNGIHDSEAMDVVEATDAAGLDIDLFRLGDAIPSATGTASTRHSPSHTFSQVHVQRGTWPSPFATPTLELPPADRLSRRVYDSTLLFPLLSSYPRIFHFADPPPEHTRGVQEEEGLAIHAALKATTRVARRLRGIAEMARRTVGIEERENLVAEVSALAEEYVEGWEESDEEGDED